MVGVRGSFFGLKYAVGAVLPSPAVLRARTEILDQRPLLELPYIEIMCRSVLNLNRLFL